MRTITLVLAFMVFLSKTTLSQGLVKYLLIGSVAVGHYLGPTTPALSKDSIEHSPWLIPEFSSDMVPSSGTSFENRLKLTKLIKGKNGENLSFNEIETIENDLMFLDKDSADALSDILLALNRSGRVLSMNDYYDSRGLIVNIFQIKYSSENIALARNIAFQKLIKEIESGQVTFAENNLSIASVLLSMFSTMIDQSAEFEIKFKDKVGNIQRILSDDGILPKGSFEITYDLMKSLEHVPYDLWEAHFVVKVFNEKGIMEKEEINLKLFGEVIEKYRNLRYSIGSSFRADENLPYMYDKVSE